MSWHIAIYDMCFMQTAMAAQLLRWLQFFYLHAKVVSDRHQRLPATKEFVPVTGARPPLHGIPTVVMGRPQNLPYLSLPPCSTRSFSFFSLA